MNLLPNGFAQLLPIVQVIISLHLEYILQAARGTLASGSGAPSEEKALECVLRMFEGRHGEADKEALEAYMRARTHEWWQDYSERQLLSTLVRRADLRKQGIGEKDDKRIQFHGEGLRIARSMLASIPKEITLDAEGEFEAVSKLLAALLNPPWAKTPPKGCKSTLSSPNPNESTATPSGATTWSLIAPTRPSIARYSSGSGGLPAGPGFVEQR